MKRRCLYKKTRVFGNFGKIYYLWYYDKNKIQERCLQKYYDRLFNRKAYYNVSFIS